MAKLSASLEQVILAQWEDLDSSLSLACTILARYGDWESLVRLSCRPEDYLTPEDYFRNNAAICFVKKLNCLPIKVDRQAAALKKWFESEESCYRANQRLFPYLPGLNLEVDPFIVRHIAGMREVVEELIGIRPPSLVEGRFGTGATFANRGVETTVPHKIASSPTLTSDCVWFLPQFFGTAWGRYTATESDLVFVPGNRFTTVPKTSVIDRPIAVEPSLNVYYQLAYGSIIRQRLKDRAGWDLTRAQGVHRAIARESSLTREFATLDLSNASDSVSRNLVKLLLPSAWFMPLDALRSVKTCGLPLNGRKVDVVLEKFSSMGNGYTFELETTLFAAMAIYACRVNGKLGRLGTDVFVYGDDIIIPDDVVKSLTAMLSYFGFALNTDKSYSGGSPFRESCGGDYFNGVDVRGSYIKEDPSNVKGSIGVVNRVGTNREKILLMGGSISMRAWNRALRNVILPFRHFFGPSRLGDAVIWQSDETWWRARVKNSIRAVRAAVPGDIVTVPFSLFKPGVVLACALYGTGNTGTPEGGRVPEIEGVTPRDPIRSYRAGWLTCS